MNYVFKDELSERYNIPKEVLTRWFRNREIKYSVAIKEGEYFKRFCIDFDNEQQRMSFERKARGFNERTSK